MTLNNIEIEIKKCDKGYSFSSEENGRKRVYDVYSLELKQKLREIISPYGILGKGNIQYKGKNSHGDCILYHQGDTDDLPDQLTLTSGEVAEEEKELKKVDEWDKIDAEFKEIEDKWKKEDAEWKKRETELGIPTNYTEKHSWCSWNNDGSIGSEGMYIKSENQSQLITFENKTNPPQIQEISDKETEQEKSQNKNSPNSDKQNHQAENKNNQQNLSQKIDNKENNYKNVYYGVGVIFLVMSILIVWVKKKR